MRAVVVPVVALLAVGMSIPGQSKLDIAGDWVGTYTCAQGVTALDLGISRQADGGLRALFHFSADPGNPDVPEGCFVMTGRVDGSGQFSLEPGAWLMQPQDYVSVALSGQLAAEGGRISGTLVGAPSCTGFQALRVAQQPVRPAACRIK